MFFLKYFRALIYSLLIFASSFSLKAELSEHHAVLYPLVPYHFSDSENRELNSYLQSLYDEHYGECFDPLEIQHASLHLGILKLYLLDLNGGEPLVWALIEQKIENLVVCDLSEGSYQNSNGLGVLQIESDKTPKEEKKDTLKDLESSHQSPSSQRLSSPMTELVIQFLEEESLYDQTALQSAIDQHYKESFQNKTGLSLSSPSLKSTRRGLKGFAKDLKYLSYDKTYSKTSGVLGKVMKLYSRYHKDLPKTEAFNAKIEKEIARIHAAIENMGAEDTQLKQNYERAKRAYEEIYHQGQSYSQSIKDESQTIAVGLFAEFFDNMSFYHEYLSKNLLGLSSDQMEVVFQHAARSQIPLSFSQIFNLLGARTYLLAKFMKMYSSCQPVLTYGLNKFFDLSRRQKDQIDDFDDFLMAVNLAVEANKPGILSDSMKCAFASASLGIASLNSYSGLETARVAMDILPSLDGRLPTPSSLRIPGIEAGIFSAEAMHTFAMETYSSSIAEEKKLKKSQYLGALLESYLHDEMSKNFSENFNERFEEFMKTRELSGPVDFVDFQNWLSYELLKCDKSLLSYVILHYIGLENDILDSEAILDSDDKDESSLQTREDKKWKLFVRSLVSEDKIERWKDFLRGPDPDFSLLIKIVSRDLDLQ